MKIRIILGILILSTVLLTMSCVTSHDQSADITCEEFGAYKHMGAEFTVEVGDKVRVNLCSSPTTGFKWEYTLTGNSVTEEDHDFEEPVGDIVGAAGTEMWTYEAVSTGTSEVSMEYSQPWDDGTKAVWTCTIHITVK